MAQDIEEFLRMAAARKKQQAEQAGQAPPANQANQPAQTAPLQPQQPPQQTRRPASRPLQQREPDIYIGMEEPEQAYSHPNLKSSIQTTVSTEDIAEHTSHLGERVHSRQEAVQSRVEQKFDHDLGKLQKRDILEPAVVDHGQGREDVPDLSFIGKMLMNPGSAKQAFVLKEIFDRPSF